MSQDETANDETGNDETFETSQAKPSETLREAMQAGGLSPITDEQLGLLEKYCRLLWDWNEKLNLTRHTNFDLFAKRDLLDVMQLSQVLQPDEEILDFGTGGGVPGIPLAILRPDMQVTLCDSVGKKANAVDDIVQKLGLQIPVYSTRVQDLLQDFRYSSLVARAVGPLPKMLQWLSEHWQSFDRLLAIKGPRWVEERAEARHRGLLRGIELRKIADYAMPDRTSHSVILQLRRPRPGQAMESD